jgi:hypothetical protein
MTAFLFTTCICGMYCTMQQCVPLARTPAALMQCTRCGIAIADMHAPHRCTQPAAAAAAAGYKLHYMHARLVSLQYSQHASHTAAIDMLPEAQQESVCIHALLQATSL